MDFLKEVDPSESLIIVSEKNIKISNNQSTEKHANLKQLSEVELLTNNESANIIYLALPENKYTPDVVKKVLNSLNPGGKAIFSDTSNSDKLKFELIVNGFMNVEALENNVTGLKPKFEVGSTAKLNQVKKPLATVWKLDDDLDEDEETIDPDNLLDEDDLKKPDPTSLRVCGTTGKRKACKDCSCGLADELAVKAQQGKLIDTTDAPKSSCGSCYLGDAFRCSTCPYLGMPAFKLGEKIQLAGNQLQSDI